MLCYIADVSLTIPIIAGEGHGTHRLNKPRALGETGRRNVGLDTLIAGRVEFECVTEGRELASACTTELEVVWDLPYSEFSAYSHRAVCMCTQEEVRPRCITVVTVQMTPMFKLHPRIVVSNYG